MVAIIIGEEDGLSMVPAASEMIKRIGRLDSKGTTHTA